MKLRKIAIVIAAVMTLSGCSKNNAGTSPSELPSDMPYCRNIMETDNGYYYNVASTLSMRYTDKKTGNDIFLCAKPECLHDGNEACTATYNNIRISVPVIYNGYIYFIGEINTEEKLGYSLYKMSPDGSSIDKITDISEEKRPPKYETCSGLHTNFIIHQGYAYVAYNIGCYSYLSFIESGFAKVDIQTGKTEILFNNDDYQKSADYHPVAGCGDYVFYCIQGFSASSGTLYRYNIKTGESDKVMDEKTRENMTLACFDENTVYFTYYNSENEVTMLKAYDVESFTQDEVEINTGERAIASDVLCYEAKFFFQANSDLKVIDKKGDLLGKISVKTLENTDYYIKKLMDISNDKFYITIIINESGSDAIKKEVYYCNIDDILSGNGEWKKAYTNNSWTEYWDEDPLMKALYVEEGE